MVNKMRTHALGYMNREICNSDKMNLNISRQFRVCSDILSEIFKT